MIELIINPIAGNGRAQRVAALVQQELTRRNIPHHLSNTKTAGHATALAREAIANGADSIAVLGGDGLLSEVSQAMCGTDVKLLFIPCGTGNDFIKSLGLPKSPIAALRLQLDSPSRRIDCGLINRTPFTNVAGTGMDIDVLVQTEKYKHVMSGIVPYTLGLIKALWGFQPFEAEVTLDGKVERRKYTLISVANGRYFGGGMRVAPMADVSDGAFDVILIDALPKWKIYMLVSLFPPGLHTKLRVTRRVVCKDVVIKRDRSFTVEVDGELSVVEQAHFQIKPNGLLVCCPAK